MKNLALLALAFTTTLASIIGCSTSKKGTTTPSKATPMDSVAMVKQIDSLRQDSVIKLAAAERARFVADSTQKRRDFPNLIPIRQFFESMSENNLYYAVADRDTFLFRTKWEKEGGIQPPEAKMRVVDNPLDSTGKVQDSITFSQYGLTYYMAKREMGLQFDPTKKKVEEKKVRFYIKPRSFNDVGYKVEPDFF